MPGLSFLTITLTFICLFVYCLLISLRVVPLSEIEQICGLALSSCWPESTSSCYTWPARWWGAIYLFQFSLIFWPEIPLCGCFLCLLAKPVANYNYTFTDKFIFSLGVNLMFIFFIYARLCFQYLCISNLFIFGIQPLSQRDM